MNRTDFNITEGFPLDTEALDFLQSSYKELQAMTAFGGNNVIVSGCVVAGANVGNGFVIIGNELLPFRGGLKQTRVIIKEETFNTEFENGALHKVYFTRYATFGNSNPNVLFDDLTRLSDIKTLTSLVSKVSELEKKVAPFNVGNGGMVLWKKPAANIPVGWAEVVDWRGRMPVGWNPDIPEFDTVGKPGGSRTHQNTLNEMPPHSHPYDDSQPQGGIDFGSGSTRFSYTNLTTQEKTTGTTGGVEGVAEPYSIMNPFRIVMFIEYIGG